MSKYRYFIRLSYKGTNYHGWQIQPNGVTVQGEITKAVRLILRQEKLTIVGAGRTDTGVHAHEFYAHIDLKNKINDLDELKFKLNRFLPQDIAIHDILLMQSDAHARFDAQMREYHYFINIEKNPFSKDSSWYLYGDLDVDKMNEAASRLLSHRDFTSFSKLHTQVKTNNCRVVFAHWSNENQGLVFKIAADRFLRNMVRAIVGSLVEVGKGRKSVDDFEYIIQSKNRTNAGESAPAQGLFLWKIEYDFEKIIAAPHEK